MKPSTLRRVQWLAIVGTLILTLGAGPRGVTERSGTGLQVQGVTVQGNVVTVVVANMTTTNLSGILTVRPPAPLLPVSISITVPARQTRTFQVNIPGLLSGGVTCGVVLDDGAPF